VEGDVEVPESTLHLGGLALAQAAWAASGSAKGVALDPIAFVRRGAELQLMRFEASSQALAIQGGRAALLKQQSTLDAWAFAREGLMDENAFGLSGVESSEAGKVDVLAIDAWSHEMSEAITLIQAYQPNTSGRFRVLGDALFVAAGQTVDGERAATWREQVYAGVQKHEQVAPLWRRWRRN